MYKLRVKYSQQMAPYLSWLEEPLHTRKVLGSSPRGAINETPEILGFFCKDFRKAFIRFR